MRRLFLFLRSLFVCSIATVVITPTIAHAALVTENYTFSYSGFQAYSPVSTWSGSFTIIYDPNLLHATGNLIGFNSNLSPFEYLPTIISYISVMIAALPSVTRRLVPTQLF